MKSENEHQSVTFLKSLYEHCDDGGYVNLRFLPSAKNLFIPISKINSIQYTLDAHKEENIYFGVATRRNGDGSKGGILQIPCLWIDLDLEGFSEEEKNEVRKRYRDFPLKPSFLLDSGGGVHIYWMLRSPATKNDIGLIENIIRKVTAYFGGDMASTDASRILRVPQTFNYKYDPPRRVTMRVYKPEKEYDLSDFDFLPEVENVPGEARHLNQGWEREILEGVEEGERNDAITRLAGRYLGKGLSREETLPILLDANSRFKPPLPHKEIEIILDSIIRTHQRNHPSEEGSRGHHFSLIQAKDIVSSPVNDAEWIWEGVLPSGGLSLVVAKPKVGKTTFSFNLSIALSRGDFFLGRRTQKSTVIYLALEEKRREFQRNLNKIGVIDEPLFFHFGPAPVEAMREVEQLIKETGAKFLVIDILQKFCRVKDLNDYAQVTRALEPLMSTARALNCHIQLVHHAGKRDRDDGDDILGSTGLLGGVDTSIHIKKRDHGRRTFFTIQRYGQDTPETVITLKQYGSLEAAGSREEVEIDETIPLVLETLEAGPVTINEIWDGIEKRHDLVTKALHGLLEKGEVKRFGSGKKGDPFRYEKNPIMPSPVYMGEGGKEFFPEENPFESQKNFLPHDSDRKYEVGEGMGKEFIPTIERTQVNLYEGEI